MNEINPYKPPQIVDENTDRFALKRGVGVATILLLTPIAVSVAFFTSCLAAVASVDPIGQRWGYDAAIPFGLIILILPPFSTLLGMIVWAVLVHGRRKMAMDTGAEEVPGQAWNSRP